MSDDSPLKSSYELAMERLRAEDKSRGEERKPLDARQKREIARLREEARAKVAELEIMQGQKLAEAAGDPEKLQQVQEHERIDRRRIESWLESGIAKVKSRSGSD